MPIHFLLAPIPVTQQSGKFPVTGGSIPWEPTGGDSFTARMPVRFEDVFESTPTILPTIEDLSVAPGETFRLAVSIVAPTRDGFDIVLRVSAGQLEQLVSCTIFWLARV